MPMSASEYAKELAEQRRPGLVKELQEAIEAGLKQSLTEDRSWCTVSLRYCPLPDDVVYEAAAVFSGWKCEITDGSPDGRELHLTIPEDIKRAHGLS